jgi:tRNA(Ile)-lysidine synthase
MYLRTKQDGDSYFYGGINRKLKKLFIDKKIHKSKRPYLPIIADDSGILWIPGFPLRDFSGNLSGKYKWVTVFVKSEDK